MGRVPSREKIKNKNHLSSDSKSSVGKASRTKGHNYERKIAKEHRDIGFERCLTTRQASRLWDDCKLDLFGVPINTQLKNVSSASVNYLRVLNEMKIEVSKNLPERENNPFVIIHKKGREEVAVMSKADYYLFLEAYKLMMLNKNDTI